MTEAQAIAPGTAPQTDAAPVVTMIPGINIQVFCDDQNTAGTIQSAAQDRRMAKAHMDVHMGGIEAAVQTFAQSQTPNVIVVESMQQREGILADLDRLAQYCDAGTKVIVIGHVNDIILFRELMGRGVSDYLVGPLHQLQIVESIGNLYSDPDAAPIGRIMAFVGAKGGVGSSTIAHNVAWVLSNRHALDTIVTDLDMAFGTASLNFNRDAAQGIAEALNASDRVDQTLIERLLTKCGDRLSLLAAPISMDRNVDVTSEAVDAILDVVRSSVPFVVVDVPNLWVPWTKHILTQADDVIVTATPELASLRNTKNLVDHLKSSRPNDAPPRLVVNQVGMPKRPEIPVGEFTKAIGLSPAVILPHDVLSFGNAMSNGQLIPEVAPKSKASEALLALSGLLSGRAEATPAKKSLLGPLMNKLPSLGKK